VCSKKFSGKNHSAKVSYVKAINSQKCFMDWDSRTLYDPEKPLHSQEKVIGHGKQEMK